MDNLIEKAKELAESIRPIESFTQTLYGQQVEKDPDPYYPQMSAWYIGVTISKVQSDLKSYAIKFLTNPNDEKTKLTLIALIKTEEQLKDMFNILFDIRRNNIPSHPSGY